MTNKVPIIKVNQEIKKVSTSSPYIHDLVCLIGGMETDEAYLEPTLVTTIEEARTTFGDDVTIAGNSALEQILGDNTVSGVLVVNITNTSGDTIQRNLTATKLGDAITALDLIDFDILYVADDLTDALLKQVTDFAEDRFENKNPFGYVTAVNRATVAAYTTTAGKVGDYCYALINQKLTVNEDELTLVESGAFITKLIATSPITESLTATVIPDITGIQDVYTFGTGEDGETLTGAGYLMFRLINATTNTYESVNGANNNGLSLYVGRVRDYLVREFSLRQFLGDPSNDKTIALIKTECARIKNYFIGLELIEGMDYDVQEKDSETVEVIINTIQFAGVITEIDVYITIEVI